MCVVSFVGDQALREWEKYIEPWRQPYPTIEPGTAPVDNPRPLVTIPQIETEIEEDTSLQMQSVQRWLRKLDKILIAAKKFDEETGQPDCEIEEKMVKLKELAEVFHVRMEFFDEQGYQR